MLYHIDIQHYLVDMIDYFTREELLHFQYAIISAKIANNHRYSNVTKLSSALYPTPEIVSAYAETGNRTVFEKMYMQMLEIETPDDEWIANTIYCSIINPLLNHKDVLILCDRNENVYIETLCKHLKEKYAVEALNLNTLFSEGSVGPITINRNKITNKAVDIRRMAGKAGYREKEATEDGRMSLLQTWSKKIKIAKLKELGIDVKNESNKELDALLIEEWVKQE